MCTFLVEKRQVHICSMVNYREGAYYLRVEYISVFFLSYWIEILAIDRSVIDCVRDIA